MQPAPRSASSSTRPGASPLPRQPQTQQINTQTHVLDTVAGRILCIADIRGRLSALNDMAREVGAKAIIHTGDFGFFEANSLDRINDRTLRHLTMYSPLIPSSQRNVLLAPDNPPAVIRNTMTISLLSEFPLLLSGQLKLNVPVYTVWGACEDVLVLEKFRLGTYDIENLHIIDEATTRCLDVGGVKLRLLGLGGAFVPHKMFDNGDGNATIAGGQGTMWTTALQLGELVDTAQRVHDPSETRLLVTHASPGREGIVAQLALVLKADLTMSAGLHFRYASSYNEFSVQSDFEGLRRKIMAGKDAFDKVWDSVKTQVEAVIDENQRILLEKALSVIERVPSAQANLGPGATATGEEPAWKNCWNWNLCDAAYGSLVLDIKDGRVSAELKSQGFNYAYRRTVTPSAGISTPHSTTSTLPNNAPVTQSTSVVPAPTKAAPHITSSNGPSKMSTPPPHQQQQQSAPGSGKETPKDSSPPKVNGAQALSPSDRADKEKQKRDKKKEKKDKDKHDREVKEKDVVPADSTAAASEPAAVPAQAPAPSSGKATPMAGAPAESSDKAAAQDSDAAPLSPRTDSPGARTPTFRKPPRNPWTLFVRMVTPATETELRDYFGDAKGGITRVNVLPGLGYKNQRIAYVEFGDEEAMKAGLEKREEKLKDAVPYVVQAEDRESREHSGGYRGRGRGRGGGGAYAARGFAMAGLTRQQSDRRTNGEGPVPKDGSDSKREGGA